MADSCNARHMGCRPASHAGSTCQIGTFALRMVTRQVGKSTSPSQISDRHPTWTTSYHGKRHDDRPFGSIVAHSVRPWLAGQALNRKRYITAIRSRIINTSLTHHHLPQLQCLRSSAAIHLLATAVVRSLQE